ncbi:MAG: hypothetical protein HY742_03920 [Deltaproteobacteria bacterium]|nr:hypothetical protein [Deltaproteobacteria bacterium]
MNRLPVVKINAVTMTTLQNKFLPVLPIIFPLKLVETKEKKLPRESPYWWCAQQDSNLQHSDS